MRRIQVEEIIDFITASCFFVLITSILSASLSYAETKAPLEKIKIGVSVPLTGAGASYGIDIKNALVFANQRIANSAYELIIEDDQCSNREAVTVAHRFVDVEKVKYVLGFGCSGTVLAAAPVYDHARVIVVASGTGAPAITSAGDYIFRTKPSLTFAADLLAKDMAKKYKKVGIVTEETDYCQGLTQAITKTTQSLGVEVINENFLPGSQDFRSLILKLKTRGVDAIFLNPQGDGGMVDLYKQFTEMDWKVPVYGTFLPGGATFISAFGPRADGIVYADIQFNSEMLDSRGRELYAEFEKEYGKARGAEHFGALSLVAFSALNEAIKGGSDVKEYLYRTQFHDLAEEYSFDRNGDVVSNKIVYVLKTLKNGAPSPYNG